MKRLETNSHHFFSLASSLFISLSLPFLAIFISGCLEKTVYPEVILTVSSVTPYELTPTSSTDGTGRETYTLPTTQIALQTMSKVPSQLVSFNVAYSTRVNQPLPSLRIDETPYDLYLPPETTTNILMNPYSERVLNLFLRSSSDISPIKAVMTLTIKDVLNNTVKKEATCLLNSPN